MADLLEAVEERQNSLDALALEERRFSDDIQGYQARIAELNALKVRFDELARVHASDIDRLEGLEEGGFLLQRFATINCPLCGASPDHQKHDHGLGGIEEQRHAVELEMEKIPDAIAKPISAVPLVSLNGFDCGSRTDGRHRPSACCRSTPSAQGRRHRHLP